MKSNGINFRWQSVELNKIYLFLLYFFVKAAELYKFCIQEDKCLVLYICLVN